MPQKIKWEEEEEGRVGYLARASHGDDGAGGFGSRDWKAKIGMEEGMGGLRIERIELGGWAAEADGELRSE